MMMMRMIITMMLMMGDDDDNDDDDNEQGWLDVDKGSLQSTKFSNIFAIGDCT